MLQYYKFDQYTYVLYAHAGIYTSYALLFFACLVIAVGIIVHCKLSKD